MRSPRPMLLRALLVGEPRTGAVQTLPGVALLPALVSSSRSPVAPLFSWVRRWFCWARALQACRDVEILVGISPPLWARRAIGRRRARSQLSPATWVTDSAAARDAISRAPEPGSTA